MGKKSYCKEAWGENYEEGLKKVKQAVEETKGIVLVSGGDIIRPPFCRMSNGKTRDITEYVVHTEKYGYLKSVDCGEDIMAKEAVQYAEIPQEEFQKILKKDLGVKDKNLNKITIYKDSLNYVKEVQIGENRFDGEEFREAFELPSSCYFFGKNK